MWNLKGGTLVPIPDDRREQIRKAMDEEGAKVVAARLKVSRVTLYRILWRGQASDKVVRCLSRETTETIQAIPIQ